LGRECFGIFLKGTLYRFVSFFLSFFGTPQLFPVPPIHPLSQEITRLMVPVPDPAFLIRFTPHAPFLNVWFLNRLKATPDF